MAIIDTKNSTITPTRDMTSLTGSDVATSDPYSIFNNNIGSMLTTLQKTNTAGNAALGGAANTLTNESITGNGAKFNPEVMSDTQVANQQSLQAGFNPAISSLNTQIANNNQSIAGINTFANTMLGQMKGQYTYQLNPQTGKFDSYNQNTGTWLNDNGSAANGKGAGSKTTLVNGANFAAYNPVDPDYSTKIQGMITSLQKQMPNGFDAVVADTILTQHKSPITSHMIDAVSTSTGMDPVNIMAQLGLESGYGTSNVASEDNNPLGVAWRPSMTNAVQGTPRPANEGGFYAMYKSMQDGLYAGAKILADKTNQPADNQQATGGTVTADPQGNLFSNTKYQMRVNTAIASTPGLKSYIKAGPGGVAYIDANAASQLDPRMGQIASKVAADTGIPVESSDDMGALNDLTQYMQEAQTLVDKNLGTESSPTGSALTNYIKTKANEVIKNSPDITEFNAYIQGITSTVDILKSLAGGAGSGLRITGTEIAGIGNTLPTSEDSWQSAQAKMLATNKKISQVMHTMFPDFDVTQNVTPQSQTLTEQKKKFTSSDGYSFPTQEALNSYNAAVASKNKTSTSTIPFSPALNSTGGLNIGYTPPSWLKL